MTGKECAHGIERWNVCREALRAGASVRPAEKPPGAVLEQSAEGCRSPAVAELAGVQRDYSKRMEELLRDRLPRLMHGEEDPQEERAEAAALFAEYAIDFAAQGVRSALLAALAAMDQQMNCEEQQGKEHPV